ncbi:hypothetical protein TNCV_5119361 [Trichonephila clavipes]|nr:hypothetical protein TNCV_5119361 [Trichonephila clavipes]
MEGFANTDPAGSHYLRSISFNSYLNEELFGMLILCGDADCIMITQLGGCTRNVTRTVEDLSARISVAAGKMRGMAGIFQNMSNSIRHHCQVCQMISGRNLESLMSTNFQ